MKKKYYYLALVLLLVALAAALVGWLRQKSAAFECDYVVQDQCAWCWPLQGGDTIYQSLDGRRFSLHADSVATAYFGIAHENIFGIVQLPSFNLSSQYSTPFQDSVNHMRDSVAALCDILRQQSDEMDYYHNTHSPLASGYHEVSELGSELLARINDMDSLLSLWPQKILVKPRLFHKRTLWQIDRQTGVLCHVHPRHLGISDSNWLLRMGIDMGWRSWSDGVYVGQRDSTGQPHGLGTYRTDRKLYSGEWEHGQRSGSGVGLEPGRIIMSGSWSRNNFVGEESYYDSTSVFGIDISRYQHEIKKTVKVLIRKRMRSGKRAVHYVWSKKTRTFKYGIAWGSLRVTSVGKNNSVNVHGRTDFPVSFVYIKATQGTSIRSRYYASDAAAARRYGIAVGAYHFFSVRSGVAQARHFLSVAKPKRGDLPPVLDVELTSGEIARMGGASVMIREIHSWLDVVRAHCGTAPVLYVSQRFVDRYLSNPDSPLRDYPVWIARYSNYRPYVRLSFWQLTPDGVVSGITGNVDVDVFNGTHSQFVTWHKEHACH